MAFFVVVGFSRGRCLSECCWFGCRCRGDAKSWVVLVESAAHTKSLSIEFHFEPSCAVVSQVASFVRSLLSLNTLVGCIYDLMSSSHLLAGLPCFPYPFCLVHIAAFQLNMSFVQRPSWCLAIILACFQFLLLSLRIHDVVPFAANKSSAL